MITILLGISGSGKSTYTEKKLKENPNLVRLNRDSLRTGLFMMDRDYYGRKDLRSCENIITNLIDQTMYDLLNAGKDIILDNTHLKKEYLTSILRKYNHLDCIELVLFEVDAETAKERVLSREGDISVEYIDKQYNQFKSLKKQLHGHPLFYPQTNASISFNDWLPQAYLVDLDGTLARKAECRNIFDENLVNLDTEIEEVGILIRGLIKQNITPVFVSGRTHGCYEMTKKWLEDKGLWMNGSSMYMREIGDSRPDYIVKEELIVNHVRPNYNVIAVVDDRLGVIRMWEKLGIFVVNVNQGNIIF